MLRLVLHLALIALLALEGAAVRAAAPPSTGLEVHLCSGGTVLVPGDPAEPSHQDCLDCCLAAFPVPPPKAPAQRAPVARLRRPAAGRSRAGRPASPPRARDPPLPFA